MSKQNPLLDEVFLEKLYLNRHKIIYAKIIALNNKEEAMEQIEGQVTGGSISLDGSSNVRRSCNLTMVAKDININSYYWGIKNKFKLYVGLNNTIDKTYDDIIWFPFGTMIITNFSTSLSVNNYTISISGKDKMCLLNGELSGSLFASVDFGKEEVYDTQTHVTTIQDIPIKNIIREAVHEYAQEPWENIIINDLDDYGLELLDYKGSLPLYLIIDESSGSNEDLGDVVQITLNGDTVLYLNGTTAKTLNDKALRYNPRNGLNLEGAPASEYDYFSWEANGDPVLSVAKIEYGQTCGYRYTDITYAGDLILGVGESITSMLDKLVQMLGNWEYFYDVDGRFIFQRKRTYMDKTWNNIITNNDESYIPTIDETYVESSKWSSAVSWNFTDSFLVTAFNNTPVLNNVRNDYSIWGTRQAVSGVELPVHLRYAIDKKPTYYKTMDGVIWTTEDIEGIYINGEKTTKNLNTIVSSIKNIIYEDQQQKIQSYEKTPNSVNLSEEWWDILDWANYYALLSNNQFPSGTMSNYANGGLHDGEFFENLNDRIKEPTIGKEYVNGNTGQKIIYDGTIRSFGKWPAEGKAVYVVDVNDDGSLGYYGHGTNCSHTYINFVNNARNYGITSYIYKPTIPIQEYEDITEQQVEEYMAQNITIIVNSTEKENVINNYRNTGANVVVVNHCDWREIIFQMAKDYRKYAHVDFEHKTDEQNMIAEQFYILLRNNNGKTADGEWRYPNGKTGYEQYYTDLEGFWRQLYCPPQLLAQWWQTGVWTDRNTDGGWTQGDNTKEWTDVGLNPAAIRSNANSNEVTITLDNATKTNITYFISTNWVNEGKADQSGWNKSIVESPATINFWFDFLDVDIADVNAADFAKYSVPAIGDRAKSVNDNMVKAIYFREIPNTIFVKNLATAQRKSGYTYMQYQENMSNLFTMSTQGKCAVDVMEEWINNYVYAIESANITTIPIYHLQPNTRINIADPNSKINGNYIISRLSIPLTYNGTMSITATKVADRVY